MQQELAIKIVGLHKRFGRYWALHGLDLEIPRGGFYGLLGPNGAGKTTTFRLLTNLAQPTGGSIEVLGKSIVRNPRAVQRSIGYLPESPTFPGWMTAFEFLEFLGKLDGLKRKEARKRAEHLLEKVGLGERKKSMIEGFSRGMLQRLGIAQALIHQPPILLLDEPVSALDPLGRLDIFKLLESLRDQHTIILSSHILDDIERLCKNVAFLKEGKVILQGETEKLKKNFDWKRGFLLHLNGKKEQFQKLASSLKKLQWIEKLETVELWDEGGALQIWSNALELGAKELPRKISDAGLSLWKFEMLKPSLEELFVKLQNKAEQPVNSEKEKQM